MHKTVENGVVRINGLSFLEYSNSFRGYSITHKSNGVAIPKFLLFWNGVSVTEVKKRYDLRLRKYDN